MVGGQMRGGVIGLDIYGSGDSLLGVYPKMRFQRMTACHDASFHFLIHSVTSSLRLSDIFTDVSLMKLFMSLCNLKDVEPPIWYPYRPA